MKVATTELQVDLDIFMTFCVSQGKETESVSTNSSLFEKRNEFEGSGEHFCCEMEWLVLANRG
jgi:hypothetical protein